MITREHGNLKLRVEPAPHAAHQLEKEGWAVLTGVFTPDEIEKIRIEIDTYFEATGPEASRKPDPHNEYRHGMLNVSAACQKAVGHPQTLDVIDPLLGEDCHVIANTAWRNVRGHQGGPWHIDAGPHVPRPKDVPWDDRIPYPIFAIGSHIYLEDCPMEAGPTAVLPGSHRSGQKPPLDRMNDINLTYENQKPHFLTAKAGDVALFVSDVWHRGTPAQDGFGRFFLQAHYGRRDIAQRILTTDETNHVSKEAAARAGNTREHQLLGLHRPFFYDA